MSLYEALDQFVGAGVLAAGGIVGAEMPPGAALDGAAFSVFLREQRLGEEFGQVLDALAHEIWLAQDQRGFPQRVCESHAAALAKLLAEVRLSAGDLLPAVGAAGRITALTVIGAGGHRLAGPSAREQIAAVWLARARAEQRLERAGLIEDVARFLLESLWLHVIDEPRLLAGLKAALLEWRQRMAAASGAQAALPPSPAEPPRPTVPVATPLPSAVPASPPAPALIAPAPIQQPMTAAVAAIKARHGLEDGAVRRFQSLLASQSMTGEQRLARLDELCGWLVATVKQLTQPSNEAPELRRLKAAAAAALMAGDLERAMELLREVRSLLRDERRRSEARLAEEIETLRQRMIAEAEAAARLGELALARCEYGAAAELFAEAAGNLPTRETAIELDYRQRQAEALAAKAETTGDMNAIAAAAAAFRAAVKLIDKAAEPSTWARVHVGLGDMLMALGTCSASGQIDLEAATAAYEEAVVVIDRAAHPMRWALVQLSRAAALIETGHRAERDRHWLAAASALMPALEVFEARGATDLANAARAKLRLVASALEPVAAAPGLPARAV